RDLEPPAAGRPEPPRDSRADEAESYEPGPLAPPREPAPDLVTQYIQPRELTDSDVQRMTAMWRRTYTRETTPHKTIKSEARSTAISDSRLVIQRHAIRQHQQTTVPAGEQSNYELLDIIGEGGVGVVYAARQASIDRTVALKMLRQHLTTDQDHQQKFLAEAVVTGRLEHPNIVPIYELGSDQHGALFYSMKRVQGTPWLDAMREKSVPENLEILLKVCDAIAFAHSRKVVHRDLKPENIMLGEFGEVLVMDWGIALSTAAYLEHDELSKSSSMGGTPAYMAPEMATGPFEAIGTHSDIYLLGGMLYEILTGQPPHGGQNIEECLQNAARNVILPTTRSGELMEIALKALATRPEQRYTSVQAFQAAIREYESHSESVLLSNRAQEELAEAQQSGDYQDYQRALFGFQEAFGLWDGNDPAAEGIARTRLAYAQRALRQEDYDLGISLLDQRDPSHADLLHRLYAGRDQRDSQQRRAQRFRAIAASLAVVLLIGAIAASAWFKFQYDQITVLAKDLDTEKQNLQQTYADLAEEKGKTDLLNQGLSEANAVAETRRQEAEEAKTRAEQNAQRALVARNEATRVAYRAAVVAAASRIEGNEDAGQILVTLQDRVPHLLHYEFGRLNYLARRRSLNQDMPGLVEAVDVSTDGRYVVAGTSNQVAEVWEFGAVGGDGSREAPRLLARLRHDGPILAVAFDRQTPSQTLALAGGDDQRGTVSLWNLADLAAQPGATFDLDRSLTPQPPAVHQRRIRAVSFANQNSNCLLTASEDGTARIWYPDPALSEQNGQVLAGHGDTVWSAAFSADDRWVVTAGEDGSVRVWLAETGTELQRFREHQGPVQAAAFAPQSSPLRIASADANGRILLWTPHAEQLLEIAQQRSQASPESVFLTSLTGRVKQQLGVGKPEDDELQIVRQLDEVDQRQQRLVELRGHASGVRSLQFSPGGRLLVSGGDDNTLRVWDPRWTPGMSLPDDDDAELGALRRDARARWQRARSESTPDGDWLKTLSGHGSSVTSCQFVSRGPSAGGSAVVSGSFDGTVRLWDLEGAAGERTYQAGEQAVRGAVLSDDGRFVVTATENGLAHVFDAAGQTLLATLTEGHSWLSSKAFYFQQDGQWRLLTAAGDGSVRLWDADKGVQLAERQRTGSRGLLAISSPLGRYFATGSVRKTVQVWDSRTLELKYELLGEQLAQLRSRWSTLGPPASKEDEERRERAIPDVTCVAFSPDDDPAGGLIYVGNSIGVGFLFDQPTGQLRTTPVTRHSEMITAAEFTADGQFLLSASDDGRVLQWNVALGQAVGQPLQHAASVDRQTGGQVKRASVTQMTLRTDAGGRLIVYTAAPSVMEVVNDRPRPIRTRVRRWTLSRFEDGWQPDSDTPPFVDIECNRINSLAILADPADAQSVLISCSGRDGDFLRQWDLALADTGTAEPQQQVHKLWPHEERDLNRGTISWATYAAGRRPGILTVGGKGARLWSHQRGWPVLSYRPAASLLALDVAPSGTLLAPRDVGGQRIEMLQVDSAAPPAADAPLYVLTAGEDNAAKIWECRPVAAEAKTMEFRAIARFDWGDADDPARQGHTAPIRVARFLREGQQLLVLTAGDDGTAKIWQQNAESGLWEVRWTFAGHDGPVLAADVSPDCDYLATAGEDKRIVLWKVPAAEAADPAGPVHRTEPASEAIRSLAFSPDCRWLAAGIRGDDFNGLVWQVSAADDSLRPVGRLRGHSDPILALTFSADGQRLVSASADETIRVWNLYALWTQPDPAEPHELDEMLTIKGHVRPVNSIRFSPDGKHLLSGSDDGRALLWLGDFVDPSLRLSDGSTNYVAGGVAVDAGLLVAQPSRLRDAPQSATYRVRISIGSDEQEEQGSANLGRLELASDADSVVLEPRPDGASNVSWREPASGQLVPVGRLSRDEQAVVLDIQPEATAAGLQAVLRQVRFIDDTQRPVDVTRYVEFTLHKLSGQPEAAEQLLLSDRKQLNLPAN
ncbi:MAG: serine/threonine protein kinase, partial [Pirellulaceae bacterium]|nr:serine/threonine protein kinase [Pirellulaceae bacterium]